MKPDFKNVENLKLSENVPSALCPELSGYSTEVNVTLPFPPSHSFSWDSAFCFLFSVPPRTHHCLCVWAVWWNRLGAGE